MGFVRLDPDSFLNDPRETTERLFGLRFRPERKARLIRRQGLLETPASLELGAFPHERRGPGLLLLVGRKARVDRGKDGRTWIEVGHGEEMDFFYSVRPRPYQPPSFVLEDPRRETWLIGPGLEPSEATRDALRRVIAAGRRLVADADKAGHPDSCLLDFRTPLAGNRRAVRIAVIEDAAAQPGGGNQAAQAR